MPTCVLLSVAPLYCMVAPRWGRGAATEPCSRWPGVRPRGPEGRVGWGAARATRGSSTRGVIMQAAGELLGLVVVV